MLLKSRSGAAKISECGQYRYWLARDWYLGDDVPNPLVFVMLNPSTADAEQDDATITRCMRRAANLGYNGIRVVNLFALRSTDPANLLTATDPVGPDNDKIIANVCRGQRMVIAAWGEEKPHVARRADAVKALLRDISVPLQALALTKAGHPRHPLYVSYSAQPAPLNSRGK